MSRMVREKFWFDLFVRRMMCPHRPSERTAIHVIEINRNIAYGGNIWDLGCGL